MATKTVKRTYVRQADVKERIVASTLKLLLTRDPDALTIREIATHAKTHHRYIPDYFGGKGPLFAEVLPLASAEIVGIVQEGSPEKFPSKELKRMIRLMAWLSTNEPAWFKNRTLGQVLDVVTEYYRSTYGLDPVMARQMGQRLVSAVVTAVLFPEVVMFHRDQTRPFLDLDREIAQFLAKKQKAEARKK